MHHWLSGGTKVMLKHGRLFSLIYGLALAMPLAAQPVSFDGTYIGKRILTNDDKTFCLIEENASVTIKGGDLTFTDSNARDYAIAFKPRADGSFSLLSANIGGAVVAIRGRISGNALDADVTSAYCEHHWHLEKR
jgi:hypothetical protein